MPSATGSRSRILHLDGIRGVAIGTVLAVHWIGQRAPGFEGGYVGVDLFFVLSGFIITLLLVRQRPGYGDFMRRRVRRLYPPLLGALVGGVAIAWVLPDSAVTGPEALRSAGVALVQLSSPWAAAEISPLAPFEVTWSLSIEWYFYLLWPLAVVRVRDLEPARAARLLAAAAVAIYLVSALQPAWWFYYGPLARFAELTAGGALACLVLAGPRLAPRLVDAAGLAGLAFVAVWTVVGPDPYTLAYRLAALPLVVLVAGALVLSGYVSPHGPVTRLLSWRPLVWLGAISYTLYLWHYLPLALFRSDWMGQSKPVVALVCVAVMVVTTAAAYVLLERPFIGPRRPARTQDGLAAAP